MYVFALYLRLNFSLALELLYNVFILERCLFARKKSCSACVRTIYLCHMNCTARKSERRSGSVSVIFVRWKYAKNGLVLLKEIGQATACQSFTSACLHVNHRQHVVVIRKKRCKLQLKVSPVMAILFVVQDQKQSQSQVREGCKVETKGSALLMDSMLSARFYKIYWLCINANTFWLTGYI